MGYRLPGLRDGKQRGPLYTVRFDGPAGTAIRVVLAGIVAAITRIGAMFGRPTHVRMVGSIVRVGCMEGSVDRQ